MDTGFVAPGGPKVSLRKFFLSPLGAGAPSIVFAFAGVHMCRALGFGNTSDFDPFLLLDDFRYHVQS